MYWWLVECPYVIDLCLSNDLDHKLKLPDISAYTEASHVCMLMSTSCGVLVILLDCAKNYMIVVSLIYCQLMVVGHHASHPFSVILYKYVIFRTDFCSCNLSYMGFVNYICHTCSSTSLVNKSFCSRNNEHV